MATANQIDERIINWAATRLDDAVMNPMDGYYPFKIIAEAYEQGVEHAEKHLKEKMRSKYFENAKLLTKYINETILELKKELFYPTKFFAGLSTKDAKLIFAVSETEYLTDNFIDKAYSISAGIKDKAFADGLSLNLGFVIDGEQLNLNLLEEDGFDIAMDLNNNLELFK